ncbi:MAG TPA: glycosyltransferase family 39 protein [Myxococcales bacterium]|nr:glycosyltransferase family 39 protein [Myxococcales bacterium]
MPKTAAEDLRGRTEPWTRPEWLLLAALVVAGLLLRLYHLSAEGFGDDEVRKWLSANEYIAGRFGGEGVEHPMLMKLLITGFLAIGRNFGWAAETITRLPNAIIGGFSTLVVAQLGKRLFGRTAGLFAACLSAVCITLVGYQRVAKEDTLLGLFLMLLCLCFAEANAAAQDGRVREQKRWELWGAASLAGMLASKYFAFLAPIALVAYFWLRAGGSPWHVPFKRWMQLIGVAFLIWCCVNWSAFYPSTWRYAASYVSGQQTVHGSLFFMGRIYHNLVEYGVNGTPPWFYVVFAVVKLAPLTILFSLAGLAVALWQRKPAHRIILSWMAVWFFVHSLSGSKWGRFFTSVLPAFLLLAGYAASLLLARVRARWPRARAGLATAALGAVLFFGEAAAAVTHAPHYRLYINAFGGGDRNVTWFFPHCDYFDAGFREAIQYIAANAEQGAEISTEIDWPSELYAKMAGRTDFVHTLNRRGQACRSTQKSCYVVVQTGRLYFLNQDAVANLAQRTPWHVERIRGEDVVKVYKLAPGELPYPGELPGPGTPQRSLH